MVGSIGGGLFVDVGVVGVDLLLAPGGEHVVSVGGESTDLGVVGLNDSISVEEVLHASLVLSSGAEGKTLGHEVVVEVLNGRFSEGHNGGGEKSGGDSHPGY